MGYDKETVSLSSAMVPVHLISRKRGAEIVKPLRLRGEEGTTATLQPLEAEEISPVPAGPHSVLQ